MPSGRFAPSPTGELHLGNLRTALLAWLFARYDSSSFWLRMEDLDQVASRPEVVASQLRDLNALGIDWDGPLVFQSQRLPLYATALESLIAAGFTYPCFCTRSEVRAAALAPQGPDAAARYPGTCRGLHPDDVAARLASGRRPALRLRASGEPVVVDDRVMGRYTGYADDVVVSRNDATPAYNLAVVVDDAEMGVELVVRGSDLLAITPSQVEIARALGLPRIAYAHVPLLCGPDGERLAKRHGAVTLTERMALGQSARDVLAELATSVGLCDVDDRPAPADLVAIFARSQTIREQ